MNVFDLITKVFNEDSPENRPYSPPNRPTESRTSKGFSPLSPVSPRGVTDLAKEAPIETPAKCNGCHQLQIDEMPTGRIAYCVRRLADTSGWKFESLRIDGLKACPQGLWWTL